MPNPHLGYGHDDGPKGSKVLGVTHWRLKSSGEGDVDVVAKSFSSTTLCRTACTWEEVAIVVPVQG